MKKLRKSFTLKVISFILCSVTLFGTMLGAFGTLLMLEYNIYTENRENVLKDKLENIAFEYAWKIGLSAADWLIYDDGEIYGEGHIQKSLVPYLEESFPSVYFEIFLADGTKILSNYNGESFRLQCECTDRVSVRNETGKIVIPTENEIYYDTAAGDPHMESLEADETSDASDKSYYGDKKEILAEICTKVYVKKTFVKFDKMLFMENLISVLYRIKFACPAFTVLLFFVSLLLLIFILYSAGYKNSPYNEPENAKNGKELPSLGFFDKIPFDILTAVFILFAILEAYLFSDFVPYINSGFLILLTAAVVYADILVVLFYLYTFAVRCKTATLLKNTIFYIVSKFIFKAVSKLFSLLGEVIKGLPLVIKTVLGIGVVLAAELFTFFLCILWNPGIGWLIFWWFIENLILVPLIIYVALQMKKLKNGCREISSGNLSYKIDTRGMPSELREHGEHLNSIGDGMSAAVDEKLKSERLKTELITNVSHDIKTPLTSIINYVDLLKKEEPENEKSKEYLAVLERQCARLKKLIYDLVEASKASTGNISAELSSIEGGVLLGQVLGEYETRIKEAGLELILTKPEYPLCFIGDGNLMWRIFDNLMNNICKYAQKGTRVYVNLEDCGEKVKITFKNISKYQLNISEDELMERFVRADSSRSTEGSGLGLSIAESLASLQGGKLTLSVDGDLFKATVEMKKV